MGLTSVGFAANNIKDVSPGHWAYDSVKKLINKGYLSLYQDNTFRGNKSVSRYELAEIVARILEEMNSTSGSVEEMDINTIRKLTVEFRQELVEVIDKQDAFGKRIKELEKNQIVIKEDMARKQQQIDELIDQLIVLKELKNDMKTNKKNIAELENKVEQVEKEMEKGLSTNVSELNKDLSKLNEEISNLKATDEANAETISSLEKENAQLKEEITTLQEKNKKTIYYIIGGVLLSLLVK